MSGGGLPACDYERTFDSFLNKYGDEVAECPDCFGDDGKTPRHMKVHEVKKEGPNKGKLFYTCNTRYGGCGKFEWHKKGNGKSNSKKRKGGQSSNGRSFAAPSVPCDATIEIRDMVRTLVSVVQKQQVMLETLILDVCGGAKMNESE